VHGCADVAMLSGRLTNGLHVAVHEAMDAVT
jgi:hypothetical protein